MKKEILAILAVTAIFTMCFAGIVSAAKAGYGFSIAQGADITAWDGAVSPATEWDDSYKDWLYDGWAQTTSFFRTKWGTAPGICENWMIEFIGDTTNDAGDWWELCADTASDGAATPQADDFKVNWSSAQGTKVWKGTGTTWTAFTGVTVGSGGDVFAGASIAASPASATPHRIVEIYLAKTATLAMAFNNNERLAIYNAATGKTLMWPPVSSANDPNSYGAGTTVFGGAIPEGLTVGIMVALSSVAVVVGTRYFKKPKI